MVSQFVKTNSVRLVALLLVFALLMPMFLSGAKVASAKAGDIVTYGIIKSRPTGTAGVWVLTTKAGVKSFTATSATQLNTLLGPLNVGVCAKVKQRSGRVHEISREPAIDCTKK